ncbi:DUF4123 domain-containing protein [Aquipseudomonas alcaligenes]|uniref:DUF4123 domain-containing protein n=1 Tax=Aquipseudomonas alcaligenes TaxID=43263 RepID=UPI003748CDE6
MALNITSPFIDRPSPHLRCLVLEAVADTDLHNHLYQLNDRGSPQWEPLFHGTPYEELLEVGPALICSEGVDGWASYASNLFEQSNAGCVLYLEQPQDWDKATEHCKSLLTIRTSDQQDQLMRFFEPRWLEPLLASLSAVELQQFFGPFSAMAWRNELGWRYAERPSPWDGTVQKAGWLTLSPQHQRDMEASRLRIIAEEMARDYQAALPAHAPAEYVHGQLLIATEWGVQHKAHYERWLRLAISHGEVFWQQDETRTVLNRDDLATGEKLDELESL